MHSAPKIMAFKSQFRDCCLPFEDECLISYEPGSKLVVLGMVIPPLIGNPYNGYINPYYWVDDHPLLYGNNRSLDASTYPFCQYI